MTSLRTVPRIHGPLRHSDASGGWPEVRPSVVNSSRSAADVLRATTLTRDRCRGAAGGLGAMVGRPSGRPVQNLAFRLVADHTTDNFKCAFRRIRCQWIAIVSWRCRPAAEKGHAVTDVNHLRRFILPARWETDARDGRDFRNFSSIVVRGGFSGVLFIQYPHPGGW